MRHMITQIISVRNMSINDSDVQGRIVRGGDCEVIKREIVVKRAGGGAGLV